MFLYPLAVVLILLTLCGRFFRDDRRVLRWTIGFTAAGAVFDFLRALPEGLRDVLHLESRVSFPFRSRASAGYARLWRDC